MQHFFYNWRFYSFGREQYQECMNSVFLNNLLNLRKVNTMAAILAACLSFFPIVSEMNIPKAGVYLGVALVALLISLYSNYVMQQIHVNNKIIYMLISLYYLNIMIFAIYLDVWANPGSIAAIYPCLLICALLMFVNPAIFNFILTLGAVALFTVSVAIIKQPVNAIFYIANAVVAGILSQFLFWYITKLQLGLEISATKLEEERNKYVDQSITDELTQLRNRRDFNYTFQRYLSNYRSSDDWLCLAIADIDFFKNFNDHYGHSQGDDCLRRIGKVLNGLSSLGVYSARVGGEEFALLWFEKDPSNLDRVVSVWTEAIRNLKIRHEKSKVSEYVTMSIGIYVVKCGSHHDTQELYELADKALYTAKSSGRNCTIVRGDEIKQYKITPNPIDT